MKKRIAAFAAALVLCIGMTSCAATGMTEDNPVQSETTAQTTAQTTYAEKELPESAETETESKPEEPIDENTYFNNCYSVRLDPKKWESTAEYKELIDKHVEQLAGGQFDSSDFAGDILFYYNEKSENGVKPNIVFSEPVYYEKYKDNSVIDLKDKLLDSIKSQLNEIGYTYESDEIVKIGSIDYLKTVSGFDAQGHHMIIEQYVFFYKGNMCSIVVASGGDQNAADAAKKVLENIKLK